MKKEELLSKNDGYEIGLRKIEIIRDNIVKLHSLEKEMNTKRNLGIKLHTMYCSLL